MRRVSEPFARLGTLVALLFTAHVSVALAQTGTITGVVTDSATGAPISGAFVSVVREADQPKFGQAQVGGYVASATTAADGSYTLTVPPADNYWLQVTDGNRYYDQVLGIAPGLNAGGPVQTPVIHVTDGETLTENIVMKPTTEFNSTVTLSAHWANAKFPSVIGGKIEGYPEATYGLQYDAESGDRASVEWDYEILDARGNVVDRGTKSISSGVSGFTAGGFPSEYCGFYSDPYGTRVGKDKVVHYHFDLATMTAKLWPVGSPTQAVRQTVRLSTAGCHPVLQWKRTSAGPLVAVLSTMKGGRGLTGRLHISINGQPALTKMFRYRVPSGASNGPLGVSGFGGTPNDADTVTLPKATLRGAQSTVVVTYAPLQRGVAAPAPLTFTVGRNGS